MWVLANSDEYHLLKWVLATPHSQSNVYMHNKCIVLGRREGQLNMHITTYDRNKKLIVSLYAKIDNDQVVCHHN